MIAYDRRTGKHVEVNYIYDDRFLDRINNKFIRKPYGYLLRIKDGSFPEKIQKNISLVEAKMIVDMLGETLFVYRNPSESILESYDETLVPMR